MPPRFGEVGRPWAGAAWLFGPAVLPRCPLSTVLRDFCPCRGLLQEKRAGPSPLSELSSIPATAHTHTHTHKECAALRPRAAWYWAREGIQANKQALYSLAAGGRRLPASCSSGRASRGRVKTPAENVELGARPSFLHAAAAFPDLPLLPCAVTTQLQLKSQQKLCRVLFLFPFSVRLQHSHRGTSPALKGEALCSRLLPPFRKQ